MTATDTNASTLLVAIDISKHRHEVLISVVSSFPEDPSEPRSPIVLEPMADKVSLQHRVGQQPLQLGVLILQRFQPGGLGHLHPAILGLRLVER